MIQEVVRVPLAVSEDLVIQKRRIGSGSPRLCVVTGTHGDELEGQYVAWRLNRLLQENAAHLHGTVDIYPALNPLGISTMTRGMPLCDLDMNRTFPGSRDGAMSELIAARIIEDISGADLCIDIHASNIFLREIPQVRINVNTAEKLVPLAKYLNMNLVWIHAAATVLESTLAHSLPYNPLRDRQAYEDSLKNNWGIQFSHTLEEQIGGQLRAGFRLVDLYEDTNGRGNLHDHNVPAFIATYAVKE